MDATTITRPVPLVPIQGGPDEGYPEASSLRQAQDRPSAARTESMVSDDTRPALRFITCGSVDDGKSTLIGRLLLDSRSVLQDQLANVEVEGQAGAGMVKVLITCRNEVKRITIDPSLLADDKDMLEDLLVAATNDALRRAEQTASEKMGTVTAGLPLPAGFKLPF